MEKVKKEEEEEEEEKEKEEEKEEEEGCFVEKDVHRHLVDDLHSHPDDGAAETVRSHLQQDHHQPNLYVLNRSLLELRSRRADFL